MAGFIVMKIHQRKNGYWYVRKRVPEDVRRIVGKTEFVESLKTKDKSEAAARAPEVIAEVDRRISEARLKLAPKRHDTLKLKPKDLHVLADMCIAYQVEQMEEAHHIVDYINHLHDLSDGFRPSKRAADRLLLEFLEARHIALSPKSASFDGVSSALLGKWDVLNEALIHRGADNWGAPVKTTLTEESLSAAGRALVSDERTISALYDEYKNEERAFTPESKRATLAKRFRDIDQVARWFIDHVGGDLPITRVTKRDVAAFIDKLRQRPKVKKPDIKALSLEEQVKWALENDAPSVAISTTQKDVKLFQSVFSYAVDKHYINENPFSGALRRIDRKISKAHSKKSGYRSSDLKRAFGSNLFRHRYTPVRKNDLDYGASVFWVPLLCYYTGARLNEIAQLHLSDVRKEEGVWCIDINPNSDDKRTKNGGSRIVPLHRHILELGFLEYVDEGRLLHRRSKSTRSHRVFPMLIPNTDGDLSAGLSRVLGRRLKQAGISNDLQPIHGLRHTFKTNCRRLNVPEDVHDAITGHSGTSVGRGYGGVDVNTANQVVQSISQVDLPVKHFKELMHKKL